MRGLDARYGGSSSAQNSHTEAHPSQTATDPTALEARGPSPDSHSTATRARGPSPNSNSTASHGSADAPTARQAAGPGLSELEAAPGAPQVQNSPSPASQRQPSAQPAGQRRPSPAHGPCPSRAQPQPSIASQPPARCRAPRTYATAERKTSASRTSWDSNVSSEGGSRGN